MSSTGRLMWLDSLKCALILIVVFGHSLLMNGLCDSIVYCLITSIQMPLFIFVSGYLLGNPYKQLGRLGHKVLRLLVPFCVWGAVLILLEKCLPFDIILNPQLGLWFLWALAFDIMALYGCCWISVRVRLPPWSLLALCWFGLQVAAIVSQTKLFGFHQIAYYFVFLAGGYLLRQSPLEVRKTRVGLRMTSSLIALWLIMAVFCARKGNISLMGGLEVKGIFADLYRFVTAWLGVLGWFWLFQSFQNASALKVRVVVYLGQMTLGIYAVHSTVMALGILHVRGAIMQFLVLLCVSVVTVMLLRLNGFTSFLLLGETKNDLWKERRLSAL